MIELGFSLGFLDQVFSAKTSYSTDFTEKNCSITIFFAEHRQAAGKVKCSLPGTLSYSCNWCSNFCTYLAARNFIVSRTESANFASFLDHISAEFKRTLETVRTENYQ